MILGATTACAEINQSPKLESKPARVYFHFMSNDIKPLDINGVVWRQPDGELVSCEEKLVLLRENLEEIRQECQDTLEDAVLMGCDETQVRDVLEKLARTIENPYPQK